MSREYGFDDRFEGVKIYNRALTPEEIHAIWCEQGGDPSEEVKGPFPTDLFLSGGSNE